MKKNFPRLDDVDSGTRTGLWVAGGLWVVMWLITGIFYWQLTPEIPLYYSLPAGAQQLAKKEMFLLLPTLVTIFLIFNVFLLNVGQKISRVLVRIVVWSSVLIMFLSNTSIIYLLILVL